GLPDEPGTDAGLGYQTNLGPMPLRRIAVSSQTGSDQSASVPRAKRPLVGRTVATWGSVSNAARTTPIDALPSEPESTAMGLGRKTTKIATLARTNHGSIVSLRRSSARA